MLFNSLAFAFFLPLVFALYWAFDKKTKAQNLLLLFASYTFYGWWDYRFLSLIAFSSLLDYGIGLALNKEGNPLRRRALLGISLGVNLGFLGVFKYFNFFAQSLADAFMAIGYHVEPWSLQIVLPVGISFYTFQTLSYSIDIYRKQLEPSRDLISFMAFVSFFPQLVAGPIERASNLLPQFYRTRVFNVKDASDGLRQMLWGMFKKVVIADNCAYYANEVFANYDSLSGSSLLLGLFFFTIQIYGDFSGYSDIAIGVSRLFGFQLMRNFAFPYFSRDIAEFWRRWHISLSTWFRDYLYIPLGGSRGGLVPKVRNTFIIFTVSGFWHGASWTFVFWGFLNACFFLPLLLSNKNRRYTDAVAEGRVFPEPMELLRIIWTFLMAMFAWLFFRSQTLGDAFAYLGRLLSPSIASMPSQFSVRIILLFVMIGFMFLLEWLHRGKQHGLDLAAMSYPAWFRYVLYVSITGSIAWFAGVQQDFIYFQF